MTSQDARDQNLVQALRKGTLGDQPLDSGRPSTRDLATDASAELDALAIGFRERTEREDERFRLATDSEFWFALCFKSRDEKDAFLKAARLMHIVDRYLDGRAAAAVLGVDMPTWVADGAASRAVKPAIPLGRAYSVPTKRVSKIGAARQ